MSGGITIALDAMGGERAPDMVLKGADMALQRYPELRFLVFGAQDGARARCWPSCRASAPR